MSQNQNTDDRSQTIRAIYDEAIIQLDKGEFVYAAGLAWTALNECQRFIDSVCPTVYADCETFYVRARMARKELEKPAGSHNIVGYLAIARSELANKNPSTVLEWETLSRFVAFCEVAYESNQDSLDPDVKTGAKHQCKVMRQYVDARIASLKATNAFDTLIRAATL